MSFLVVSNTNILVEASPRIHIARDDQADNGGHANIELRELQRLCRRQVNLLRDKVRQVACSAAWAEDCLYRGADYAPNFRCACARCRAEFPDRLHPRQARESDISGDCQVEMEEDPELAEDIRLLRNDRPRIGSVFVGTRRSDRGAYAWRHHRRR